MGLASLAQLIESERSERSEHTVVLSLRFLSIYLYIVTKILRKIHATTFTERLGKITHEGPGAPGMSTPLPISLGSATLYPFTTHLNSMEHDINH